MIRKTSIGVFLAIIVLISAVSFLLVKKVGKIPTYAELQQIQHFTASEIYSADGMLLGRYFIENRTNVSYEEISPNIINALIATEDVRFFEHTGIDFRSLMRVLVKTILLGDRSSGGGSTLSQQLIKNLYPRKGSGVFSLVASKFRESIIASRLEEIYSKEELLTLYLNTVSFGEDIYGIETASLRYFNKLPGELTVPEAAVLIGLLKATTYYNPRLYPDHALYRRNTVIGQMEKYGYISEATADSFMKKPIDLNYVRLTNEPGTAPYFRERVRPMIEEILKDIKKPDGSDYDLYTDGLKMTLPIDSRLQKYAETALSNHMKRLQKAFYDHWRNQKPWDKIPSIKEEAILNINKYASLKEKGLADNIILDSLHKPHPMVIYTYKSARDTALSPIDSILHQMMLLHAGFVAMEPSSGQIKAWVGGIDYSYFQYDHVTASRQVGSTFKPIVYAAALQEGTDPCDFFPNELVQYEEYENWEPGNANNFYEGFYSLKGALTYSVNTVSVQVLLKAGIEKVIELAHSLGIEQELPHVPSLALGTADIPLIQMVKAYATIANHGTKVEPVYLLRIQTSNGDTLWQHQPTSGEKVLSQRVTGFITNFMESVVDSGTASSLRSTYKLSLDIGGKTGTTQSHADGWFIGFTPDIVAGAWVGADNPQIHFQTIEHGQGAVMALPIWAGFMQQAIKDTSFNSWEKSRFPPLDNRSWRKLDCPLYKEKLTFFDKLFGVKNRGKDRDRDDDGGEGNKKPPLRERIKRFFKGDKKND